MKVTINQITPRRTDGEVTSVNVHFTARTEDGDINLSGSVPISVDNIDFESIENEVKQELAEKIMNGNLNAE